MMYFTEPKLGHNNTHIMSKTKTRSHVLVLHDDTQNLWQSSATEAQRSLRPTHCNSPTVHGSRGGT